MAQEKSLPYLVAPGNIHKAFQGIKSAATPPRISQDFVKTILQITGSSGDQMTSFLKKIGFADPSGNPTQLYTQFRNNHSSGRAVAAAIRHGYSSLFARNEFFYKLPDAKLRGLIIEQTGLADDAKVLTLTFSTLKNLLSHADFTEPDNAEAPEVYKEIPPIQTAETEIPLARDGGNRGNVGLNLSYTINLNLPASKDVAVFDAIFQSLKRNILEQ